ncbi:bifunctional UDP-N-acetylglucosamine diphosphorylase/glucosamine-1-phosphate N-acetyltransferase GlmU [Thermosulfidibacter takaii]|nr:bifunctional UDP-N-acetylglucosamine diphosphorylase/glucosamine-1-phosphate N-acetyltransferase GlmU [Thermosulfidibacter takaii]
MVSAVVLAAGEGKRMKSKIPKVLHRIGDKALIDCVLEKVREVADQLVVVVGHGADKVMEYLQGRYKEVVFAHQKKQLGTAHAVQVAIKKVKGDKVFVLPGDMPLIRPQSLKKVLQEVDSGADMAVLVCEHEDPTGYGRVITNKGRILKIVEEVDATEDEKKIKLTNTGVYCFKIEALEKYLPLIKNDNKKGEFYLTDIVEIVNDKGGVVKAVMGEEFEGFGVNTRKQLAEAYKIMARNKVEYLLENGVTVYAPETVFISEEVEIGQDTVIYPYVFITGETVIGNNCTIGPFCMIRDCKIGDSVRINEHSVMEGAVIESEVTVGPFARLREGTVLKSNSRVGNFVEVKKSVIGEWSKANHLAYIGDATVGKGVNIGAGTITCNYDGVKKHPTVIEDGVFIGSDTQLVAPVRVGAGSLVGAGSTITKDIPPDSLAITRAPLKIFEGKGMRYFKKKKYGIEE